MNLLKSLPAEPGVYLFENQNAHILYVGKANRLRSRVRSYFTGSPGPKEQIIRRDCIAIRFIVVRSELEALLLEMTLIGRLQPPLNAVLKNERARVYIDIDKGLAHPTIKLTRRMPEEKQHVRFGPFPSTTAARHVLSVIRKLFPYYTKKHDARRSCLFCHLGLCPGPTDSVNITLYKTTIRHIQLFLQGRIDKVVRELEHDMQEASKKEDFERALSLKQTINHIAFVTQPVIEPDLYVQDPLLLDRQRAHGLSSLQKLLKLPSIPKRIEAYDMSHLQGTDAVGSLVVVTNGAPDSQSYRRFKIKLGGENNDLAMIAEVMSRRLKHTEWPFPDLFVIDGGSAQRESAERIIRQSGVQTAVIGLAKREEVIVTAYGTIKLPREDNALQLLQMLRDEAHRFARSYHHQLRKKHLLGA
ncbi:MAG: UvrB/UvrC motif-containing protein [bacterium]|nr:UvrB/UvrC motif-containing protein [bacterium]